jgi:hypothetical protein
MIRSRIDNPAFALAGLFKEVLASVSAISAL